MKIQELIVNGSIIVLTLIFGGPTLAADNAKAPFKCSVNGNFISAWGLESKINKQLDVVPDASSGNIFTTNAIELNIETVVNLPHHPVRSGYDVILSAPGATSPISIQGDVLRQNIPIDNPPSLKNFNVHTEQQAHGQCVHVANTHDYLCSLEIVSTASSGDKILKFKSDNFVVDLTYSGDPSTKPKASPLGIRNLPANTTKLISNENWTIYLVRASRDKEATLAITGPQAKRIANFPVNMESGDVQKFELNYALDAQCNR